MLTGWKVQSLASCKRVFYREEYNVQVGPKKTKF